MDCSKANKLQKLFEKHDLDPIIAEALGMSSEDDFAFVEEKHINMVCKELNLRPVQETKLRLLYEAEYQKCVRSKSQGRERESGLISLFSIQC
jgi:hypothetical protein